MKTRSRRATVATVLAISPLAPLAVVLALGTTQAPQPLGPTEELYANRNFFWKGSPVIIPVCWENPGAVPTERREWVRDAVESNWVRYARVNFTQWDKCRSGEKGVHIRIISSGQSSAPHGVELNGKSDGIKLNLKFEGQPACSASNPALRRCARATALHEFGHVLGFYHEEERADYRPSGRTVPGSPCTPQTYPNDKPQFYGAYDGHSVMSYCGQPASDPSTWKEILSPGDIAAVQRAYGRRIGGQLVSPRGNCLAAHADGRSGDTPFMWDCDEARDDQEWTADRTNDYQVQGSGFRMYLVGPRSDRSLEVGGSRSASPVKVMDEGSGGYVWRFDDVEIRGWGGLCLDVTGRNVTEGSNVQVWKCGVSTGGHYQRWRVDILNVGRARIRFSSDLCLGYDGSLRNAIIVDCSEASTWFYFDSKGEIRPARAGSFDPYSKAPYLDKCLDVQSVRDADYLRGKGLPESGANVQWFDCLPQQLNQKWNLSGRVRLEGRDLCLGREKSPDGNGTKAETVKCNSRAVPTWDYYFRPGKAR